jgi:methyl-accepting chemotaxis protein
MRLIKKLYRLPFGRMILSLSVRIRIIVLAVIPVVGFLANGITYMSSEGEVSTAFRTVNHSAALADASRDLKSAIAEMRINVKDFTASPKEESIKSFEVAGLAAFRSLDTIEVSDGLRAEDIAELRNHLTEMKKNFEQLVSEQKALGYNANEGLRRKLRDAGAGVERIINENMTWLAETDARKLMLSLLTMRHYEAEYRLTPHELTRQLFFATYAKFNQTFDLVDGTPDMKGRLEQQVKLYADTFTAWIEGSDRAYPLRAQIDIDSQDMLPRANVIILRAKSAAGTASVALGLGLGLSWLIGRSITRPLNELADAMSRVSGVTDDARATAADVKGLADAVAISIEAESLEAEVRQFLTNVQAA